MFNVITYALLVAELCMVWADYEHREFYTHIFNGCYAVLMFVVVVFFLIYGVEVFFKVSTDPRKLQSKYRDERNYHWVLGMWQLCSALCNSSMTTG